MGADAINSEDNKEIVGLMESLTFSEERKDLIENNLGKIIYDSKTKNKTLKDMKTD